ncbi:claspin [Scaptodrosophila lebanonensis]|uniref:Claspin n=1 Tax=Drosophila lebanonensis TaxID=7225 RepID=A0A6J2TAC3_DROLE|nr:claspin [Scaptodrosophila lebanonensis]
MSGEVAAMDESAASAENHEPENDSMEKLQVDEEGEDEKNISNEDLLGGKSLLMSDDSDGDEVTGTAFSKKISPRTKSRRLLDSDEEQDAETAKTTAQVDAKSEPEADQNIDVTPVKVKKKNKISAIIDTDSEEEEQANAGAGEESDASNTPKKQKKKKLSRKKKQIVDSDKSDEETAVQRKLKGLIDSDSEQSHAENSGNEMEQEDVNVESMATDKPHKAKPMRASAKKALDEMQVIQSEQQRLHREAHISVPYHQPKPRTLKEFLSRRTVNRPMATALAGGSPMPAKEPRQSIRLRMNSEELQAYAKLMEERAKEAAEFFKSESENEQDTNDSDDEDVDGETAPLELKDNAAVFDDLPAIQDNDIGNIEQENPKEIKALKAKALDVDPTVQGLESITEHIEIPIEQTTEPAPEMVSPKIPMLVTEIVELPRLDLSTLSITPPSKPATPRITEALRRLKEEKSADISPSLKGDPNMVIDLETGDMFAKKPTGVDDLLLRLMKTREAKKHKATETVNILSTDHGKLEVSKVNIHLHEEEPVAKEQKPGAAYIKLQQELKSLITKKRLEELRKKKAEKLEDEMEEEGMDIDEEYEPEEKPSQVKCYDEDENEVTINEEEEILEDKEGDAIKDDDEEEVETAVEAVEDAESEQDSGADQETESDDESEADEQTSTEKTKRKNRIIRAFQDDDDDIDLLQTPKTGTIAPITATQLQLSAHKLFDEEVQRTASDEENELLDLCSGKFTQTQKPGAETNAIISQIPITQPKEGGEMTEELEALCSGSFQTQPKQPPLPINKILSSDEEQQLEKEKPRNKKLTKKRKKRKALGFSDDEESLDEEDDDVVDGEEEDADEQAEEVPETFVDYDSEENEIVVEMTKKDRKLRAANFLEKEAELSESEWGSADEDEQNLDKYDIELGDEDQFDREQLRSELEQIHARKMLDQDIREVRKIKEMLFEDEEAGVRQRQFRWKNSESGFSLEDQRNENAGEPNEGSGDEENEHLWRKIRYEREQLLLEKGLKGEASPNSLPLSPAVANNSTLGAVRKLNIITAKKSSVEVKKSSPFLISKTVTTMQQQQKTVRGSFLVRDKETLNKLAGMTKGAGDAGDGTAGTVSVKSAKAKNFVFATLTEEEHEHQKRKAADLLNSSNETGINFMKKPRLEPRRDKCLIDQLL